MLASRPAPWAAGFLARVVEMMRDSVRLFGVAGALQICLQSNYVRVLNIL